MHFTEDTYKSGKKTFHIKDKQTNVGIKTNLSNLSNLLKVNFFWQVRAEGIPVTGGLLQPKIASWTATNVATLALMLSWKWWLCVRYVPTIFGLNLC